MRYLTLGDRRASVIGLGLWQFGTPGWGWGTDFGPDQARAIVRRALDLGINVFDTAEIYAGGASEAILGNALGERRAEAIIASKVFPTHALPGQVRRAAARSLVRLGVEAIDLYQIHWPNPVVPVGWTMAGMRDLQRAGLVRAVGVSNFSLSRWRRAESALGGPVVSDQVPYHLLARSPERELIPYATANARVVIAYSPLAQGMLSGRYRVGGAGTGHPMGDTQHLPRGVRLASPFFAPVNVRRAEPVLAALRDVARAHGVTPAQVALAWVVRHACVIAIPGAKSIAQVEANAAAADLTLTASELVALDSASAAFRQAAPVRSAAELVKRFVSR